MRSVRLRGRVITGAGPVPAGRPEIILGVLDSGATGTVVPHVDSVAGRGY